MRLDCQSSPALVFSLAVALCAACGGSPEGDDSPDAQDAPDARAPDALAPTVCPASTTPGMLTCVSPLAGPGRDGLSKVFFAPDGSGIASIYAGRPLTVPSDAPRLPSVPGVSVIRLDGDYRPTPLFGFPNGYEPSPVGLVGDDIVLVSSLPGTERGYYVTRRTPTGAVRWEKRLTHTDDDFGDRITFVNFFVRGDELLMLMSLHRTTTDFGDGPRTFGTTDDFVVVRYALDDGHLLRVQQYGDANNQTLAGAGLTSDGDVVVAGDFAGTIDFGNRRIDAPPSRQFFARLAPDGSARWATVSGDESSEQINALAVLADDTVVALIYEGTDTSSSPLGSSLVHLDAAGVPTILAPARLAARMYLTALRDGGFLYHGAFDGQVVVGNRTLTGVGWEDGFAVRFDSALHQSWDVQFGSPSLDSLTTVNQRADGALVVTGLLSGEATLGSAMPVPQGDRDAFIAVLSP
jgi:hypothetical protein